MNVQDFILIIVLLVCIIWIVKRIILCYRQISKENDPCKSCGCGCTTYSQTTQSEKKVRFYRKKKQKTLADSKNSRTFATAIEKQTMQRKNEILVPWMSGLVSGLQNRVRRFESARNLKRKEVWVSG